MHFSKLLVAVTSLAMANAIAFTNSNYNGITAGVPFTVTWSGEVGLANLLLKNGPPENQLLVATIATGIPGGSFVWTPAASLPQGIYNLEIDDTGNGAVNFSPQFLLHASVPLPITQAPAVSTISTITHAPTVSTITHAPPLSTGGPFANASTTTRVIFTNTTTATAHPSGTGAVTPSLTPIVISQAARYASPFALVLLGIVGVALTN